jgi:hypothetical protein
MLNSSSANPDTGVVYSYTVTSDHVLTQLSGTAEDFSEYGNGTPVGYGSLK